MCELLSATLRRAASPFHLAWDLLPQRRNGTAEVCVKRGLAPMSSMLDGGHPPRDARRDGPFEAMTRALGTGVHGRR